MKRQPRSLNPGEQFWCVQIDNGFRLPGLWLKALRARPSTFRCLPCPSVSLLLGQQHVDRLTITPPHFPCSSKTPQTHALPIALTLVPSLEYGPYLFCHSKHDQMTRAVVTFWIFSGNQLRFTVLIMPHSTVSTIQSWESVVSTAGPMYSPARPPRCAWFPSSPQLRSSHAVDRRGRARLRCGALPNMS